MLGKFYNPLSAIAVILMSCPWLTSCGSTSLTSDQLLRVEIYGVHRTPSEELQATGSASPRYMNMTFESLTLTTADGEAVDFSPEKALDLRIIDRPQIFVEEELKDYDKTVFQSAEFTFDSEVTAAGKYKIRPYDLSSNVFTYATDIEVEASKGVLISIEIYWLKTVVVDDESADEIFLEPEFVFSHESK